MVTVGHNARVFVQNRWPTEREETVKRRSEGDMQRDALHWRRAERNPPPWCLWKLWRSHSARTELFFADVLSQLSLLKLVSWPTPCWFKQCPYFKVFDSSHCLCFHSIQICDHAHGLPKTWCGLLHRDCSWMHLQPAVLHAPWMVCGSSMLATQFRRPQGLIAANQSSSNLRKQYQLQFQANGPG